MYFADTKLDRMRQDLDDKSNHLPFSGVFPGMRLAA